MPDSPTALTEREKETLRLLLTGHDAKSIARHLGLSVHTVNERLRDARRKFNKSSSREAARLLAEAERTLPNSFGDKALGVAGQHTGMASGEGPKEPQNAGYRLTWLSGGMLIMSLIIAAIVLPIAFNAGGVPDRQGAWRLASAAAPSSASPSVTVDAAQRWALLLDGKRWDASWRTAATVFKAQISATQWASSVQAVRQPLGVVSSRTLQNVTKTNSLPGAPAGEYQIIEFRTSFAAKAAAIETVVMARENAGWKVAGYFIR